MAGATPNPKKRSYLLPRGCKDLIDVWQGASSKSSKPSFTTACVNGKIWAREVRVIGETGEQIGIMPVAEALKLAQSRSLDLVEIAPRARPPVCRLVDYGKFRYQSSRRRKKT